MPRRASAAHPARLAAGCFLQYRDSYVGEGHLGAAGSVARDLAETIAYRLGRY